MFGNSTRVAFLSPRDIDTCIFELNAELASSWDLFSKKSFAGSANHRRVSVRKNINYRNGWQTVFVGTFQKTAEGTQLVGHFRLHLFTIVFMAIWFGGVGVTCFTFLGAAVAGQASWSVVTAPFAMLLFGLALVKGGRYLARNEADEIRSFFKKKLAARTPN
jgi:hypothetical protein